MNLLLSTCLFKTTQLANAFPALYDAGFRGLEVTDKGDFTEEILEDLVTASTAYHIQMPNWHLLQVSPFQATEKESRTAIEQMKRSMEDGARIGAKNQVLHWYQRFVDPAYGSIWRQTIDEWVDLAKRLGVRLLLETVPDKPVNQRYVPCAEIMDFVKSYPPDVLSICLDVNHSNLKEELPDVVRLTKERLASLHISDNNGLYEQHWLPGQGVIDFPALFRSLESINYDGHFVMEVKAWCEQPVTPANLKQLYEFSETLLKTRSPHPNTPLAISLNQ